MECAGTSWSRSLGHPSGGDREVMQLSVLHYSPARSWPKPCKVQAAHKRDRSAQEIKMHKSHVLGIKYRVFILGS